MAPKKHRGLTREDAHPLVNPYSPAFSEPLIPVTCQQERKPPQRRRCPVFPYLFQRPQNHFRPPSGPLAFFINAPQPSSCSVLSSTPCRAKQDLLGERGCALWVYYTSE